MVNTNDFNAFALPGGYVYVNRGVAERSDQLDQFASVIAHEIGHVVLRHSVKQMEQMQGANLGVDGRLRADGRLQQRARRRRESTSPARRCSRSSAATTRRRPTRPASTSWFARASTRTACRRCSRSCWPSAKPGHGARRRGSRITRSRKSRIQATRDQIAADQPRDHPDADANTQSVQRFQGAGAALPPPPVAESIAQRSAGAPTRRWLTQSRQRPAHMSRLNRPAARAPSFRAPRHA